MTSTSILALERLAENEDFSNLSIGDLLHVAIKSSSYAEVLDFVANWKEYHD